MSSFLNKGRRIQKSAYKKEVKQRLKYMYKIMGELDTVAQQIALNHTETTEDNIVERSSEYSDLKIDGFEKMLLLGKLRNIQEGLNGKKNNV